MNAEPKPESWFHSPEFQSECRRRAAQQRAYFRSKARADREEVADPEDVSSEARKRKEGRDRYFSRETHFGRRSEPSLELPKSRDLRALADTFCVSSEQSAQSVELEKQKLAAKAKRQLLCGKMGHRLNCQGSDDHKFFQPYRCRLRYCNVCGPAWFGEKFSDMLFALEPVVQHLLDEGKKRGREMVIAKLDITVPNTGTMPGPVFVQKFHEDQREFFRQVERRFGISRAEYGRLGCDEFGGKKTKEHPEGNSNLHTHLVYVGPKLPQSKVRKELSALWSEIRGERSFVSIKRARSLAAAIAHALKYPAKFLSASTPERRAELEAAFNHTRRFRAGAAFYDVKLMREPGEDSPVGECPLCGAPLGEVVEPWVATFALEAEGRRDVNLVRRERDSEAREARRLKVFSGASP